MSKAQVNGITSSSSSSTTLDHFISYPLISDLINYYKSMPMGAKSIEFSQNVYNAWGKPVVTSPLVQNPYSYVYPYAKKVDELGDNTLSHIDANFPAIKDTDFDALRAHAHSALGYPFKVAGESKDYVFKTYGDEYKKTGGQGLVTTGKAIVSTELRIAADAYNKVGEWMGPKKAEAQDNMEKLKDAGSEQADKLKNATSEQAGKLKNATNEQAGKARDVANEQAGKAKDVANEQAGKARDVANDQADKAKDTADTTKKTAEKKKNELK